jgi:3-phenylpropionate/trans-cinnamate dioxygenase ferredoxin component
MTLEGEQTRRFYKVGLISEVPDPGFKCFKAGRRSVLVAHVEGQVFALEDRCTHDGGPLCEGELAGFEVTCPRHGARFDLKTGRALCLPATGSAMVYNVEVRNGEIYIGIPTVTQA